MLRPLLAACLLALPASAAPPAALPGACESAIGAAERSARTAPGLLHAIGLVESGRRDPASGQRRPWPWTVTAEGIGTYYPSKADAIAAVEALQARGVASIDVGCMQVNLMYHPGAFATLDQAFDPGPNAAYAARFLLGLLWQAGRLAGGGGSLSFVHPRAERAVCPADRRGLGRRAGPGGAGGRMARRSCASLAAARCGCSAAPRRAAAAGSWAFWTESGGGAWSAPSNRLTRSSPGEPPPSAWRLAACDQISSMDSSNLSAEHALDRFVQERTASLPLALLALEGDLLRAVQSRLVHHGLLDPHGDGVLGPVTTWALGEFCRAAALEFGNALSPEAARALLRPAPILNLTPGDDLAGRVVRAMLRRGDWICRHAGCLTVAYVEGTEPDGRPSADRADAFDDLRLLLRVEGGRPIVAGAWHATTGSGRDAVEHPVDRWGSPRLEPGQHKAWAIGRTAIGAELEQDALVQVAPLPVRRDADQNYRREGDPRMVGQFVIDQHGAMDAPRDAVGGTSAGCLVGQSQAGHEAFMRLLRGDQRWRVNTAYLFMTSLFTRAELD